MILIALTNQNLLGVGVSWSLTNIALMRREKTVGTVGNMSALSTCITRHIKKNLELSRICMPIIISSPKKKIEIALCHQLERVLGRYHLKKNHQRIAGRNL